MSDTEKLIIDIPEEIYKASQIIDVKHEDVIQIPLEVIANGIPLEDIEKRIAGKSFIGNDGLDYVEMQVVCKVIEGENNE